MADETGTASVETTDPATEPVAQETAAPAAGTTTPAPAAEESFINPSELPEELKPHWRRMHRGYTKALEKFNARKADHDLLDNFRGNESFALDLLRAEAERRGLQLTRKGEAARPAATAAPSTDVPAHVVEAVRARLDPSLQWMAESLAAGQWAAAQESTRPLVEQSKAKEKAAREQEYDGHAAKLSETAPGWEAHMDDMNELQGWLQSGAMTHPQFGDRLTFLYNAVTGGSAAKAAALRDMAAAGRNAVRTGQSARPTIPNTTERVMKARTTFDAVRVAAEEAEAELRRNGIAVPD